MRKILVFGIVFLSFFMVSCVRSINIEASRTIIPTNPSKPIPTDTQVPSPTNPPLPTLTYTPTPFSIEYNQEYLDEFVLSHTINWNGSTLNSIVWSPDSELLAFGGKTGIIWIYSLYESQFLREIEFEGQVSILKLTFSPDGKKLAAANPFGNVYIYDVFSGVLVTKLETGIQANIKILEFLERGNSLLIGMDTEKYYKTAELIHWNIQTGEITNRWSNHDPAFLYSSPILLLQDIEDVSITVIWDNWEGGANFTNHKFYLNKIDLETGDFLEEKSLKYPTAERNIVITKDNHVWLIEHKPDGTSDVIDGKTDQVLATLVTGGTKGGLYDVAQSFLSVDGSILMIDSDYVTYWDVDNWSSVEPYPDEVFIKDWFWTGWSPDLSRYYSEDYGFTSIDIFTHQ